MKKISLFLVAMMVFGLTGCSKDAEVNAFITEFDTVTKDIVAKINANPSSDGIDSAQKSFDAKKADLKAKWDAVKTARGAQVSADVQKKMEETMKTDMQALVDASTKNMSMFTDPAASSKFQKLMGDFQATFAQ
jgi:hypothetical protein